MRTLLACTLLALAGCTQILGVEDITPPTTTADARPTDAATPDARSADARPAPDAMPPGMAKLTADQTPHGFGGVVTGQTSADYTITIANDGTATSGTLTASIAGAGFVIDSDPCTGTTLAPTASCTIAVQFAPTAAGAASGTVTVAADPGGSLTVDLSGTAFTPGAISFDTTSYDFQTVDVGNTSAGIDFTLTNGGGSPTGTLAATITGDTAQFVVLSNGCNGQVLAAQATCVVKIEFAPETYGPFTLSLLVQGTPGGTASTSISGTGRTSYTLTVSSTGSGTGTISGQGLTCSGSTCTGTYTRTGTATSVVVTATPAAGVSLAWSGDCSGTTGQCTIVMDRTRAATAAFTLIENALTVATRFVANGAGKVTSSVGGINCGSTCTATLPETTQVTLTATPSGTAAFQGWGGACTGNATTCTLSMSAARSVTATFRAPINYMFVTSSTYALGSIGGLAGADDICQTRAAAAGLPGTFVAFLSTSTVNAKDRVGSARGWMRADGKPVIDQLSTTLSTGQIFYSPELDENGNEVQAPVVTGSQADGTAATGNTCADYTSTSGYAAEGAPSYGAYSWLELGVSDCSAMYALYCMQTDYTTAVSVPPSSNPVAFVSKGFFDTATGLSTADSLCQSEATAANVANPTSYKALLGTKAMAPDARFYTSAAYSRTDGVPLNTNTTSFFDKTQRLIAPLDVEADKTYLFAAGLALGSLDPTQPGANTCNDWTTDDNSMPMDGIQSYTETPFEYASTMQCSKYTQVICMYSN